MNISGLKYWEEKIMIKLELEDFIYEIKEEMECYAEIGKEGADKWEEKFRKWLDNPKIKHSNVTKKGDKVMYSVADESEIFDIADEYLTAIENNSEEEYWKKFQ